MFFNQVNLPLSGSAFHCLFTLYGVDHEVKAFEPDKASYIVIFGETLIALFFMFLQTFTDIIRNTEVKCSILSIAEEVNVTVSHESRVREVGDKNKSCNDEIETRPRFHPCVSSTKTAIPKNLILAFAFTDIITSFLLGWTGRRHLLPSETAGLSFAF